MKKLILIALLLVVVLFINWWAKTANFNLFAMIQSLTPKTATPSATLNNNQTQPTPTSIPVEIIITITPSGFVPDSLMISKNTKITWVNKSSEIATIASDPQNTFPPLNLGDVGVNDSVSLIFSQPGRYHYDNGKNPSQKGTLIVK